MVTNMLMLSHEENQKNQVRCVCIHEWPKYILVCDNNVNQQSWWQALSLSVHTEVFANCDLSLQYQVRGQKPPTTNGDHVWHECKQYQHLLGGGPTIYNPPPKLAAYLQHVNKDTCQSYATDRWQKLWHDAGPSTLTMSYTAEACINLLSKALFFSPGRGDNLVYCGETIFRPSLKGNPYSCIYYPGTGVVPI